MEREQVVLKLQVDGGKNRVLFAECGSDFVDLLFALLTLPLSTIIRLTRNHPKLVSISKLYESLAKLDGGSFHSSNFQAMLLSAYSKPEARNEDDETGFSVRFYCKACGGRWFSTLGNAPCGCGLVMDVPDNWRLRPQREGGKRNVFVGEGLRFVVTDDLRVMPVSFRSTFSLLHELGIEDCTSFRNELVTVGVEEVRSIRSCHLLSNIRFS